MHPEANNTWEPLPVLGLKGQRERQLPEPRGLGSSGELGEGYPDDSVAFDRCTQPLPTYGPQRRGWGRTILPSPTLCSPNQC